jgi:CheY-like chemotaxis protein
MTTDRAAVLTHAVPKRNTAELMRILLVEDSLADVELTLEALEGAKVANHVSVVRDGAAALEYLRAGRGPTS